MLGCCAQNLAVVGCWRGAVLIGGGLKMAFPAWWVILLPWAVFVCGFTFALFHRIRRSHMLLFLSERRQAYTAVPQLEETEDEQQEPPPSAAEVQLRKDLELSNRLSFFFAGFLASLSFALVAVPLWHAADATHPQQEQEDNNAAILTWLCADVRANINVIHAGLYVSSWSAFTETGNPRYASITISQGVYMLVPVCAVLLLTAAEAWTLQTFTPQVFVSGMFVVLLLLALRKQMRVRKQGLHSDFSPYKGLLEEGRAFLRGVVSDAEAGEFRKLRMYCKWCLHGELACYALYYVVIVLSGRWSAACDKARAAAVLALPGGGAASLERHDAFMMDFWSAFTYALHLGFLAGNACDAVAHLNKGALELVCFGKLIFGCVFAAQTVTLMASVDVFPTSSSSSSAVGILSVVLSLMYAVSQFVSLWRFQLLRFALMRPVLQEHAFMPVLADSVRANAGMRTLFSVAQRAGSRLSAMSRGRVRWAGIVVVMWWLAFQIESVSIVWLAKDNIAGVVIGLMYSIHGCVLLFFALVVVVHIPKRVLARKRIQTYVFMLFAGISLVQWLMLAATGAEVMWATLFPGLWLLLRGLVCLGGAHAMSRMEFCAADEVAAASQNQCCRIRTPCGTWRVYKRGPRATQSVLVTRISAQERTRHPPSVLRAPHSFGTPGRSHPAEKLQLARLAQLFEKDAKEEEEEEEKEEVVGLGRRTGRVHRLQRAVWVWAYVTQGVFALLTLVLFWSDQAVARGEDLTGVLWHQVVSEEDMTVALPTAIETLEYALAFHFVFFAAGYNHRGAWTVNTMFLHLTSVTSVCGSVMLAVAAIRLDGLTAGPTQAMTWTSAVAAAVCGVNAYLTIALAHAAALAPRAFPQDKAFAYW